MCFQRRMFAGTDGMQEQANGVSSNSTQLLVPTPLFRHAVMLGMEVLSSRLQPAAVDWPTPP